VPVFSFLLLGRKCRYCKAPISWRYPAIETLTSAFGANPDRAEACVALARLKALAGEGAEAGRLFERAVRLEPTRFPPMRAYLRHLYLAKEILYARLATLHNLTHYARHVRAIRQRILAEGEPA